jgi:retron-type reverse transcriptase
MSLLLRRPPGREAFPGDIGRPDGIFMIFLGGKFIIPQISLAVISEKDNRLTMTSRITPGCAGAKTRMGQEHAYKEQGRGWSPRAHAQVFEICKEMSWLLANVSCRWIPGPIVLTTLLLLLHFALSYEPLRAGSQRQELKGKVVGRDYATRSVLKCRTRFFKQQVALNSIRITHNGNACKQSFSIKLIVIKFITLMVIKLIAKNYDNCFYNENCQNNPNIPTISKSLLKIFENCKNDGQNYDNRENDCQKTAKKSDRLNNGLTNDNAKLFGIYENIHTTINMKLENFNRRCGWLEDRGSVVPYTLCSERTSSCKQVEAKAETREGKNFIVFNTRGFVVSNAKPHLSSSLLFGRTFRLFHLLARRPHFDLQASQSKCRKVGPLGRAGEQKGKGATRTHDYNCQGVHYSDQSLDATVSLDNEQVQLGSDWNILNKLKRLSATIKGRINNVLKKLRCLDFWLTAYVKRKRKQASLTRSTNSNTIEKTSLATLKELQAIVLAGSYPLCRTKYKNEIVQEVLRMLLSAIYEPRFKDCSHSFRTNRGQHSSIKYVRAWFPGTVWYMEGNISDFSIDSDILLALLRRRIQDHKFLGLIESGLKRKMIDCKITFKSELGILQAGVISPLLSNIYLHEFDRYMTRVMRVMHKGKRRKANPEYHRLCNKAYRARKKLDFIAASNALKRARQLEFLLAASQFRRNKKQESKDPMDSNYRRVLFVRYAKDFLVGVIGSKALAVRLKESIKSFLQRRLKLNLNKEKTLIKHNDKRISWLGFLISTMNRPMFGKARLNNRTIRQRIPPAGVRVYADIKKIIIKLAEKGYCDRAGNSLPNWKEALQPPQSYSVARAARLIYGLDSYYKVADNRRAITHQIMRIIRNSLAKAFASKFKLNTVKKVLAKAGKDLSKPIKSKLPIIGNSDEKQMTNAAKTEDKQIPHLIRIPFTLAKEIAKPDKSHSFSAFARSFEETRKKDLGPHPLL